jgi:hypothetical protein
MTVVCARFHDLFRRLAANPNVDDDIKAMLPEEIDQVDDNGVIGDAIDILWTLRRLPRF